MHSDKMHAITNHSIFAMIQHVIYTNKFKPCNNGADATVELVRTGTTAFADIRRHGTCCESMEAVASVLWSERKGNTEGQSQAASLGHWGTRNRAPDAVRPHAFT